MTDTVRVPREPTEAMIEAAQVYCHADRPGRAVDIYRAMLAASPQGEGSSADADTHRAGDGAWLVESQVSTTPNWWSLKYKWTGDASKAIRFSREIDADAFIDFHCLGPVAKATEHLWQATPPAMSAETLMGQPVSNPYKFDSEIAWLQEAVPTEWSERPEVVLQYAQQVATFAAKRVGCVDEWRPLGDVYGCLTQIDNCLTGLTATPQPAEGCSSNEGADGWIEWSGGENPAGGSVLDIRFRDGTTGCWYADEPSWRDFWLHRAGGNDIIAYRILPQTEKGS